ncbi:MAG: TOBE domain-containing protein [Methylococcaceae bacterium]
MQHSNPPIISGDLKLIGGLNEKLFKLLAAVDSTGSISQAAKETSITYKGAWEMIERANNLAPQALIITATGGKQGGGTQLTAAGKLLLSVFQQLQTEHQQFITQLNQRLTSNTELLFLLKRLIMKASARNQYFGKVSNIIIGAVTTEVIVELKGGDTIVATITKESAENLAIQIDSEVVVLIKAPQIILVTDFSGYKLSARNQLQGTVSRIQKGAVNAEVVVALQGGNSIAATITNESLEALELSEGSAATAVFKAGSVILGVAS